MASNPSSSRTPTDSDRQTILASERTQLAWLESLARHVEEGRPRGRSSHFGGAACRLTGPPAVPVDPPFQLPADEVRYEDLVLESAARETATEETTSWKATAGKTAIGAAWETTAEETSTRESTAGKATIGGAARKSAGKPSTGEPPSRETAAGKPTVRCAAGSLL